MKRQTTNGTPRKVIRTCAILVIAAVVVVSVSARQDSVFRSAVDLIAVDVQVVDGNGSPVPRLAPEAFEVLINGRRRRVVSADFLRNAPADAGAMRQLREPNPTVGAPAETDGESRLIILAFDNGSFSPGTVAAAIESAGHFIDNLEPDDRVGLFVYPTGPRIDPTTERAKIRAALSQIRGGKTAVLSRYNLRPSEIVDLTSALSMGIRAVGQSDAAMSGADALTLGAIVRRECPEDPACFTAILSDVAAMAPQLEEQARRSLGGLDTLLRVLSLLPGRKAVVLVSAGVLVADRTDGRPDVGDASRVMGQAAARANATVYTVQIQPPLVGMTAQSKRASGVEDNRDRQLLGNWLDNFSAAAGGMRIYVPIGGGDFAFDRVLRETSAHYLLGVVPEEMDRDGQPRELRVRVAGRGMTVRSRQWVVIPPLRGAN
jgi:VWFA-related protein